jgi:methionyl aminopeptidase
MTVPEKRPCLGADCENEVDSLQCPTCQKLGKASYFCSQDCFKKNWNEHKKTHKAQSSLLLAPKAVSKPDPESGNFNPFPSFEYTGPLRPVYPLSPRREVPAHIKLPEYAADGVPRTERIPSIRNKIAILDKKEQKAMRKVCRLTREVLDAAAREIRPGVTTDYLDEIVHKATIERNVGFPSWHERR